MNCVQVGKVMKVKTHFVERHFYGARDSARTVRRRRRRL